MTAARGADAILLGAMGLPGVRYPDGTEITPQIDLRERLGLYAGVRPIRVLPGAPTPLADPRARAIDCVLVRESTEGLFAGRRETRRDGDAVLDTMRISRPVCERLFTFAFELARARRSRRTVSRVTCVDKANVLPSMAYFRAIFLEVAAAYPDISTDCLYVDAAGLQLVRAPWTFDVLVTENMFGDILSDEAAELSGSLGLAGSINAGDRHCMAQAQHGSAPDIAGRDRANPTSLILSAAMLLGWLARRHRDRKLARAGDLIEQAIDSVLNDPARRTADLGGPLGTSAFAAELCREVSLRVAG